MNLRNEILKEHSKEQCNKIIRWVGGSQKRFSELFYLFLHGEYKVTQRAGWPLGYVAQAHPHFMHGHLEALLENFKKNNLHNAVKRNSVRILQHIDIPEELHGGVMSICFEFLESPAEPVAVKAFSLVVLGNLARKYPEIIPEIEVLVLDQLPHQTAAFKSSAKKVLGKKL